MEAMGILAIMVNCYLIAQCGQLQRLFPGLSPQAAIVCVVVLEVPGPAGLGSPRGHPSGGWGHLAGVWGHLRVTPVGFGVPRLGHGSGR